MPKKQKKIEILFKIPQSWINDEEVQSFGMVAHSIKDKFTKMLQEKITDEFVAKFDKPDIKITKEEVKDRMLTILAEKALNNDED